MKNITFSVLNGELVINREAIDTLWTIALEETLCVSMMMHIHVEEEANVISREATLGYAGSTDSWDKYGNKITSARVAITSSSTPLCITFIFSDDFAFMQVGAEFEQGEMVEI